MGFLYTQLFVTPPYPTTTFTGKTVIVTGSNVGLGLEAARHFARLEASKVILAVRNTAAGEAAKADIEKTTQRTGVVEVWPLDLSSYASVKAFAKKASDLARLDVLCENAGIATRKFELAEGEERTITVNVISTLLLALLLLPTMKATATQFHTNPHLTIVSSEVHGWTKFPERKQPHTLDYLSDPNTADMSDRYPLSKLLEVLAVRAIAPQLAGSGVVLNMLNPGLCHSSLSRDGPFFLHILKFLLARTTEVGSRTLVASACSGPDSHGKYMSDSLVKEEELGALVKGPEGKDVQEKVWKELGERLEGISPGVLKGAGLS